MPHDQLKSSHIMSYIYRFQIIHMDLVGAAFSSHRCRRFLHAACWSWKTKASRGWLGSELLTPKMSGTGTLWEFNIIAIESCRIIGGLPLNMVMSIVTCKITREDPHFCMNFCPLDIDVENPLFVDHFPRFPLWVLSTCM